MVTNNMNLVPDIVDKLYATEKTSGVSGTSAPSKANAANNTISRTKTQDAQKVSSSSSSAELKEELEALQREKKYSLEKMEQIEEEIKELAQEARDNMIEAAKKQKIAVEQHELEAKEVLDNEIKKYIEANKDGGDGMSKSQLQANIKSSMPNAPYLAQALAQLAEANEQIAQIDSLLGSLNIIIGDVKLLEVDIDAKTAQYDSAVKAEQEAAKRKSCDPIGFSVDGPGGKYKYDFIVDDGSFDSTSDFLGSQNQWAEMSALDTSGDGIVNTQELSAKNIKAVRTAPDGKQEIVDLTEEFGSDFQVDLSSYAQGGVHQDISTADHDGDGVVDQQLLGTFNVSYKGQSIKGYNTLDDVDYLEQQFGVKETAQNAANETYSADLAPHANFFEEFSKTSEQLKQDLVSGYESLGLSEDFIKTIDKEAQTEGKKQANIFMEKVEKEINAKKEQEEKEALEAKKAREAQEAKKAQEAKEAQETKNTEKTSSKRAKDSDNDEIEEDDGLIKEEHIEWIGANSKKYAHEKLNVPEECDLIDELNKSDSGKKRVERVDIEGDDYYKYDGKYYDMDGNEVPAPIDLEPPLLPF